ncbi:ABC transporter substrate-binding protein [Cohnella cellulosilytica]|uniref:ABC transporter substrate-binding protein n=2 Tax=Cohnella cellulosilytica TaxID=986710 RepID=A0ABW2F8E0_9BACL
MLIAVLVLSACGAANDKENAAPSASEAVSTPPASGSEESNASSTRIYKDALGREVEIPVQPKRVVALWTVGEILALGEKPVGSTANLLRFYSAEDQADIEIVGEGVAGDYEKVLSLEPDLIIMYELAKPEELEQFGKIAPTVTTKFFGDPYESLRSMADIMNKKDQAEQWINDYKVRVEEARKKTEALKLQEQTALVIQFALKNVYMYKSDTFPTVFDAYGLKVTDKQIELESQPNFQKESLSLEILPEFEADHLFVFINDDESRQVFEDMKKEVVWKNLTAVKKGQMYEISHRIAIKDVTTLDWALDEVYALLTKSK